MKPARATGRRRIIDARRRNFSTLAVLTLAGMILGIPQTQGSGPGEYEVKAAYLFNFGRFVEWPAGAAASQEGTFEICVLGDDPFGPALFKTILGERIDGKPVVLKMILTPEEATECRILFISSSERDEVSEVLTALDGASVLTVSDMPEFTRRGGMIQFVLENNRVRFEINLAAAERAKLNLSSQLLKVATRVQRLQFGD